MAVITSNMYSNSAKRTTLRIQILLLSHPPLASVSQNIIFLPGISRCLYSRHKRFELRSIFEVSTGWLIQRLIEH
jgi:hypothetical protein